ncbi:hypothetical protein L596_014967 [Steinernema carpocapsae]|uniref:Uncharacterized protein n=1 Tax=Steinernema carpocapsae TaxID=34508 RepID=A0A4U5NDJ1_STECR|nr:hypothetical protein L596_014967 [Steinernema carpocapsae]
MMWITVIRIRVGPALTTSPLNGLAEYLKFEVKSRTDCFQIQRPPTIFSKTNVETFRTTPSTLDAHL